MFRKSWTVVAMSIFALLTRLLKSGFCTAWGRAMSTSIIRPRVKSPISCANSPLWPCADTRVCAFLIIASLVRRLAFALSSIAFCFSFFFSSMACRRLSASLRRSFMASVASFFAKSSSFCFSLKLRSVLFSASVFFLKSACRSGMIWSREAVKLSLDLRVRLFLRHFGLPSTITSIMSSSSKFTSNSDPSPRPVSISSPR
mmetsp:Transcript_104984/g.282144  ORF Transcript_104984/g.282144 Transcript_104984/m.282144 type:complete len:201 (-) Transcript_104984:216-818(-)